jgi:hypothetical protein
MSPNRGLSAVTIFELLRLGALLTPPVLLTGAMFRVDGDAASWLGVGVSIELVIAALLMIFYRSWSPPVGPMVLVCYVVALAWLWLSLPGNWRDWYLHLVQALLVVAPLGVVAAFTLQQSGALLVHRARKLGMQLTERSNWPQDLQECRELPEVKAFREAIQFDPTPALCLLNHRRAEVRLCALAALEFRKLWRPGHAEAVLAALKREMVPQVRAAAVLALANVDDRLLVESVAESLRDPDPRVRRATADALFWNAERRWSWIRFHVRKAMADPALRHDGSLIREGQKLAQEAVHDLIAWTAEKGLIGTRAAQVLGVHFATALHEDPEETLAEVCRIVKDPHAPPVFRIELARVLAAQKAMDHPLREDLLDPANPAPLRLLAAEGLLDEGPHVRAIVCLREIARLPNRELSLATASVVQRCLGVDLGLAIGQPLPPVNSPRTVEVTRRLMAWASTPDSAENVLETNFPTVRSRVPGYEHPRLVSRDPERAIE